MLTKNTKNYKGSYVSIWISITEILRDQNKRDWSKAYNLYSKMLSQRKEKQAVQKRWKKILILMYWVR